MTERERLIELIETAVSIMQNTPEKLADYLLDHGVIVMPVNVGQPVWVMSPDKRSISRAKPAFSTIACWVERGYFGKYVFDTREKAEAALAKRGMPNDNHHKETVESNAGATMPRLSPRSKWF